MPGLRNAAWGIFPFLLQVATRSERKTYLMVAEEIRVKQRKQLELNKLDSDS